MLLGSSLFVDPDVNVYEFDSDAWWDMQTDEDVIFDASEEDDYRHWVLSPVNIPILSASLLGVERLDGSFLVRGAIITASCEKASTECFIMVTMPERIVDSTYLKVDGQIIERQGLALPEGRAVPNIAIDGFGNYELYHVPGCPDYGIGVLRKGLSIAGESWAIANDLAYILRDEHRYEQAIDAFSLLIEKEPDYLLHYSYSERARLYGQLAP